MNHELLVLGKTGETEKKNVKQNALRDVSQTSDVTYSKKLKQCLLASVFRTETWVQCGSSFGKTLEHRLHFQHVLKQTSSLQALTYSPIYWKNTEFKHTGQFSH